MARAALAWARRNSSFVMSRQHFRGWCFTTAGSLKAAAASWSTVLFSIPAKGEYTISSSSALSFSLKALSSFILRAGRAWSGGVRRRRVRVSGQDAGRSCG